MEMKSLPLQSSIRCIRVERIEFIHQSSIGRCICLQLLLLPMVVNYDDSSGTKRPRVHWRRNEKQEKITHENRVLIEYQLFLLVLEREPTPSSIYEIEFTQNFDEQTYAFFPFNILQSDK